MVTDIKEGKIIWKRAFIMGETACEGHCGNIENRNILPNHLKSSMK